MSKRSAHPMIEEEFGQPKPVTNLLLELKTPHLQTLHPQRFLV